MMWEPSLTSKATVKRSASMASDIPKISTSGSTTDLSGRIRKSISISLDTGETEILTKSLSSSSFKRRSIRRRFNKRQSRPEPEYGHDNETYEKIRERVLQERAVTNAIDALQERWRMIMYMHDDLLDLNEDRRSRKLKKLCVQRQFEFILIVAAFVLICLPISIIFINQIKS